jgi:hypothetical protein
MLDPDEKILEPARASPEAALREIAAAAARMRYFLMCCTLDDYGVEVPRARRGADAYVEIRIMSSGEADD